VSENCTFRDHALVAALFTSRAAMILLKTLDWCEISNDSSKALIFINRNGGHGRPHWPSSL
jgi:hypothetical protein